jgi:thiol-disulfide isomerase/thioredoxin
MISPYFDELSKDYKSVYFLKVDVDAVEVRIASCCLSGVAASALLLSTGRRLGPLLTCFPTSQAVAAVAGVSAMPTFQVWQKGGKVDELVGASKEKLKAMIEKYA